MRSAALCLLAGFLAIASATLGTGVHYVRRIEREMRALSVPHATVACPVGREPQTVSFVLDARSAQALAEIEPALEPKGRRKP